MKELKETGALHFDFDGAKVVLTEEDLLIDTGFRREECRKALAEGLRILGSRPERRNILLSQPNGQYQIYRHLILFFHLVKKMNVQITL